MTYDMRFDLGDNVSLRGSLELLGQIDEFRITSLKGRAYINHAGWFDLGDLVRYVPEPPKPIPPVTLSTLDLIRVGSRIEAKTTGEYLGRVIRLFWDDQDDQWAETAKSEMFGRPELQCYLIAGCRHAATYKSGVPHA